MVNPSDNMRPDDADAAFHDAGESAGGKGHGGSDANAVEHLRRELEQANERCLRIQAEMENYRRRAQREMQDERRYASQALLTDLLPVMDNIERAIEAADQSTDSSGLQEGVKIVQQQLLSMLEKHQCTRVPAAGQEFDPAIHEAIAQFPHPDQPAGYVTHVSQHGYRLHDRVIRPAQVVVSAGPPQS